MSAERGEVAVGDGCDGRGQLCIVVSCVLDCVVCCVLFGLLSVP